MYQCLLNREGTCVLLRNYLKKKKFNSVSNAYFSDGKRSEVVNSAALLFPFGFSTEQDRLETTASGAPQRLAGLLTEGTRIYSRDQSRLVERQCSCPASLCGWAGRPARR